MKKKYLEAGRIVNTNGIKGEVKIMPWADSADFLSNFKTLYIDGEPFRLLGGRVHKSFFIARFQGIENINDAMRLKNKIVFIDRDDVTLPEGRFFLQDIIGARVVDEDGNELGRLEDVLELPAGNVYVVQGGREILIPARPEFVLSTDVDAGIITVRLLEGM